MLSLVVGLIAGFAAMALKWLIHVISGSLTSDIQISQGNYMYIVYPVVGVLLACIYVRYVVRDNISHGVTRVLYSISQNKEPPEAAQHVYLHSGIINYNRVWRLRRG